MRAFFEDALSRWGLYTTRSFLGSAFDVLSRARFLEAAAMFNCESDACFLLSQR